MIHSTTKDRDTDTFEIQWGDNPDQMLVCKRKHTFTYSNARFSTGTVEPVKDGDSVFFTIEKDVDKGDEGEGTVFLLRPDEMAILAALMSSLLADQLADEATQQQ